MFGDMQGVEVIADDMIIAVDTEEEHDRLLWGKKTKCEVQSQKDPVYCAFQNHVNSEVKNFNQWLCFLLPSIKFPAVSEF